MESQFAYLSDITIFFFAATAAKRYTNIAKDSGFSSTEKTDQELHTTEERKHNSRLSEIDNASHEVVSPDSLQEPTKRRTSKHDQHRRYALKS